VPIARLLVGYETISTWARLLARPTQLQQPTSELLLRGWLAAARGVGRALPRRFANHAHIDGVGVAGLLYIIATSSLA
jgi:hypothetical protein